MKAVTSFYTMPLVTEERCEDPDTFQGIVRNRVHLRCDHEYFRLQNPEPSLVKPIIKVAIIWWAEILALKGV